MILLAKWFVAKAGLKTLAGGCNSERIWNIRKLGIIAIFWGFFAFSTSASTIYFGPSQTGSNNGTSCANAYSWVDGTHGINVASNWSPGNTLYVCQGTYTCSANGTPGIQAAGSGTGANPILIQFDTTGPAILTCGYWGWGIQLAGYSYITADGGSGGTIENTQNGSSLPYQIASNGIAANGPCNHLEVRNFTVENMYVYSNPADESNVGAFQVGGLSFAGCDFLSLHGNTITYAAVGINVEFTKLTNANIYNNTIDYCKWSLSFNDATSSSTATGINIYGNNFGGHFAVWDDNNFNNHEDGIFIYALNGSYSGVQIYNNYIHGDMTAYGTGYVVMGGNGANVQIFNNVIVQDVNQCSNPHLCGPFGLINLGQVTYGSSYTSSNFSVYNNTILGAAPTQAGSTSARTVAGIFWSAPTWTGTNIERNNIVADVPYGITFFGAIPNGFVSDDNDIYNVGLAAIVNSQSSFNSYVALPNLQALGYDNASSAGNPNLSSSYVPQNASMALGLNLTNLGITALDSDKNGVPRPPSGPWVVGALQSNANAPAPPSGVTATVQ